MGRIVVIGAGFAGTSAVSFLARSRHEVVLIDRKTSSCFLPVLPDCIGRGIDPRFTAFDLGSFCRKRKVVFFNQEVERIFLDENKLLASGAFLSYDYLIIASGSETNFYGNDNIRKNAFKLDDDQDAARIIALACDPAYRQYIVSGAGYTGIEVATNLAVLLRRNKRDAKVAIVERAPGILGPLPEWMKKHVAENLERLGIGVKCNTSVERIEGAAVTLSSKETISPACVIWAAGVKTSGFLQELRNEKNPQGRVKVDEYLRIAPNCFVAGDASFVNDGGSFLRMAVQFAITQGESAAHNCLRASKGAPLVKYRPLDLGYIIPMANNRACGRVMGMDMKGWLPVFFHYCMCIFRSKGFRNRWEIIRAVLKGGRRC